MVVYDEETSIGSCSLSLSDVYLVYSVHNLSSLLWNVFISAITRKYKLISIKNSLDVSDNQMTMHFFFVISRFSSVIDAVFLSLSFLVNKRMFL